MPITVSNLSNGQTVTLSFNISGSFSNVNAGVVDAENPGVVGPVVVNFKFDRTDAGTADVFIRATPTGTNFTLSMTAPPLLQNATYNVTPKRYRRHAHRYRRRDYGSQNHLIANHSRLPAKLLLRIFLK